MKNRDYSFAGWTHDEFIQFCILCGCDYLKNIKKLGISKIYPIFNNNHRRMKYVFHYLRVNKTEVFNLEYLEGFERAYLTFKYQRVWCPLKKKLVSLNSFNDLDIFNEDDIKAIEISDRDLVKRIDDFNDTGLLIKYARKPEGFNFLGPILEHNLAMSIANCATDPISKLPFKQPDPWETIVTDRKYEELRTIASITLGQHRSLDSNPFVKAGMVNDRPNQQSKLNNFFTQTQSTSVSTIFKKPSSSNETSQSGVDVRELKFECETTVTSTKPVVDSTSLSLKLPKPQQLQTHEEEDIEDSDDQNVSKIQSSENDKEMDKENPPKPVGSFLSQANEEVHRATFTTSLSNSKTSKGDSVRDLFQKFKIDHRNSITKQTIANFRTAYIQTCKSRK